MIGAAPVKGIAVVVEDDRAIEVEVLGLAVEDRDRFDEAEFARFGDVNAGDVIAEAEGFDRPGGGEDTSAGDFGPVIEDDADGAAVIDMDFGDAAAELQFAAEAAEFADEVFEDQADPFVGSGESFEVAGAKHDAELAVVHVIFAGVAVPHQGAEDHFAEQRVGDQFAQDIAGAAIEIGVIAGEVVVVEERLGEFAEAVDRAREFAGDFAFEQFDIVAEIEGDVGKADRRADLFGEGKVFPIEAELADKFGQRAPLGPFAGEVGHRVEADVIVAAAEAIERVKPADGVVAFEDADTLVKVCQADPGGQAAHPGTDDDRVVHAGLRP